LRARRHRPIRQSSNPACGARPRVPGAGGGHMRHTPFYGHIRHVPRPVTGTLFDSETPRGWGGHPPCLNEGGPLTPDLGGGLSRRTPHRIVLLPALVQACRAGTHRRCWRQCSCWRSLRRRGSSRSIYRLRSSRSEGEGVSPPSLNNECPHPRFAGVFIMSRRVRTELLSKAMGWG
jgi:hypothetical protein